jgi:O-antigen ligase
LFFEIYLIGKYKNFSFSFVAKIFLISVLVMLGSFFMISNNTEDIQMLSRFSGMYEERLNNIKEDRDYEWESAFNQFLDSPLLGDAFVTDYDKSYCHNILLDVMMSTGLLGGVLFSIFFNFLIVKLNYLVKRVTAHPLLIAYVILFLTALLGSIFSGGLFNIYPFWLLSAFILRVQLSGNQENITIN